MHICDVEERSAQKSDRIEFKFGFEQSAAV